MGLLDRLDQDVPGTRLGHEACCAVVHEPRDLPAVDRPRVHQDLGAGLCHQLLEQLDGIGPAEGVEENDVDRVPGRKLIDVLAQADAVGVRLEHGG